MSDTTTGFQGETPTSTAFLFEVEGEEIGMFSEIEGLEVTVEVATYAEGGENGYVHKLPGRMSWPHIVLKRGVTNNDTLFEWVQKTAGTGYAGNQNKLARSTASITAISSDGKRLRSWNLVDAFAVRWIGPKFDSSSSSPLQEEIELAHHGFTVKTY